MATDKTPPVDRAAALDAVCQHRSHAAAAAALGITAPELRQALLAFPDKPRKPRPPRVKAAPAPEPVQPPAPSTADLQATVARLEANAALQASMIERLMAAQKPTRAQASTVTAQVRQADADEEEYGEVIFGVERTRAKHVIERPSSRHIRVLTIGDTHFHPGLPQTLRLMALVGHHAAATRPEHIVHIGDGSDWNSCCRHVRNDTWRARKKPSIAQDLRSFEQNWKALNDPMDRAGVTPSRHYCLGNHDQWLLDHEDAHPEAKGLATDRFFGTLEAAGWSRTEYGEYAYIGGVGFVHVPLNLMGRPMGGATPENSVASQSNHDVVFGHTHRANACRRVKTGFAQQTTALNAGGCMPDGYVGEYAHNSMGSAVTSGVLEVDIFDGRVQSHRLTTSRELDQRYGHLVTEGRA